MAKPSFEEFRREFEQQFGADADAEKLYMFTMRAAAQELQKSPQYREVISTISECETSYSEKHPDLLLSSSPVDEIKILVKPFDSVVHKIYRRNVLYNKKYPDAPPEGKLSHLDYLWNIDDILRGKVVCRYMDGPEFVCKRLQNKFTERGFVSSIRENSTEAGYYGWHFYFRFNSPVLVDGRVSDATLSAEIQFTTQLADVISALTHTFYRQRRSGEQFSENWKWRPRDGPFKAAYLGHGLHLLEGMIQTLKDDMMGPIPDPAAPGDPHEKA